MGCLAPCPGIDILDERAFLAQEEWNALLARSHDNRLFYRAEWHAIWWEHFGFEGVRILAARGDNGELQALLPLQCDEIGGQRVLSLVGDHNVADYMDALADKSQAAQLLETLWNCALSELGWDAIELRHVPSGSRTIVALEGVARRLGLVMELEDDEVCPVAILCSTWSGYLDMLSKKQRHEIRRKLRRLEEGATIGWRTVGTTAELENDLEVFFRLHEASARDKAHFLTPAMRSYFHSLTTAMLSAGRLRLSILSRDGIDIAASLAFVYRDRYLLYNSGYDPEYAALSPGIAAVAHAMQDAIDEEAVAFDFLSGDEPYKYQFGATNTYTARVSIRRF